VGKTFLPGSRGGERGERQGVSLDKLSRQILAGKTRNPNARQAWRLPQTFHPKGGRTGRRIQHLKGGGQRSGGGIWSVRLRSSDSKKKV